MHEIFNNVIPIFSLILIGWAAVRLRYMSADNAGVLTSFVFKIGLPLLLLRTIANADFNNTGPVKIWISYFGGVAVAWTVAALVSRLVFHRDRASAVIIGLSGTFSNIALLGIPLVSHVAGDAALVALSLVLAIHMPVMMVTASVLVERAKAQEGGAISNPLKVFTTIGYNLITSPIVIGLAAGAIIHLFDIPLEGPVGTVVEMLASMAAPVALVAIGMTLTQYKVAGNVGLFSTITFIKLVLMPGIVFLIASVLGLPHSTIAGIVLTAAAPSGVNAFVLANQFGTGKNIAASTITLTAALGVVTVSFWVLLLGY
nr:AEC family transporter [Marinicella sp. W31]MDC2878677.1 AEC family transporter [Marinicella sp. W31]